MAINHTILTHSTAIGGPSWTPSPGSRKPKSKWPHSRCSHRTAPILSHYWHWPNFGALHSSTITIFDDIMFYHMEPHIVQYVSHIISLYCQVSSSVSTTPLSYLISSPESFTRSIPYPSPLKAGTIRPHTLLAPTLSENYHHLSWSPSWSHREMAKMQKIRHCCMGRNVSFGNVSL